MSIKFTQYLMPDGRKQEVTIERDANVEQMANELIQLGYKFEIEMLRTGEISMTIEHPSNEDGEPLVIRVIPNGPLVPIMVDDMVFEGYTIVKKVKNLK